MTDEPLVTLTDGRLLAIAGTQAMMAFELAHDPGVFTLLQTPPPPSWPPDLNDDDSFGHFLNALRTDKQARSWGLYYLIDLKAGRRLVGCGGFVAPPDDKGAVEIGYSILADYRRQGYATGLCRLLIDFAFKDDRTNMVIANTYPHLAASIGVMENAAWPLRTKIRTARSLMLCGNAD